MITFISSDNIYPGSEKLTTVGLYPLARFYSMSTARSVHQASIAKIYLKRGASDTFGRFIVNCMTFHHLN